MTDQNKKIRVRFAPSPTGFIHLGGLRTVLYNFLFAKNKGGTLVLRIEDTDRTRFVPEALENILTTLEWAGITDYEGPKRKDGKIVEEGNYGPYVQSDRLDLYKKYAAQLVAEGNAYPCFCSSERLEQMRKEQELKKLPPMYDGTCRNLSSEEVQALRVSGTPEVVRMRMPKEGTTSFEDAVHGRVEFQNALIDDQVIIKSDGFPTYHLAVVVDDHLMEITHVFRGEEWLSSTPKHLTLYRFFGWEPTTFAHLPLILKPGGKKLSKRDMASSVFEYIEQGYLREALMNFVALLGWHPEGEQEVMSIEEMAEKFNVRGINKSGAIFTTEKLDWLNGLYIRKMSHADFVTASMPFLVKAGLIKDDFPREQLEKMVALEQERVRKISEVPEAISYLIKDPGPQKEILPWKKQIPKDAGLALTMILPILEGASDWTEEALEKTVKDAIEQNGMKTGDGLWPMRVALSGREASPGPFEIAAVLGKDESLKRIKNAIQILK